MPEPMHLCGDCRRKWWVKELKPIKDVLERVEPGESMPSGECPECHALCHPMRWVPNCPHCHGIDLEWRTYAFFKVTGVVLDAKGEPDMFEIALDDKPASVDYVADGDVYCNDCGEFHGRPRGWDTWTAVECS